MNKSKIEWCDYTWNPVTGCLHGCDFCYAKRIDKRFGDGNFTPTFHPKRLIEPLAVKKPSRIFVGSMADLFGDWMWDVYENGDEEGFASGLFAREYVVKCIIRIAKQCPQHTFIFLTKNPKGMQGFNFPANCWCGTSVENQEKADGRRPELLKVNCKTLFVSYEPALGPIDFKKFIWNKTQVDGTLFNTPISASAYDLAKFVGVRGIDWLIIGAQTGPGAVKPKMEWLLVAEQAQAAGIPVFVKDNAANYYGGELLPRQFPKVQP